MKKNINKFNLVHPTSIIEDGAKIGKNVRIGPYCIIEKEVEIGDDCNLLSHVIIKGKTKIGKSNKIFSFATLGEIPQDLKYKGEKSKLLIGDNNTIREHCTIHLGTKDGNMITKIGNNNLFMVNVHIAHDCDIGNNCIFSNNATLAGHIIVEDNVVLGGVSAVHQFVRIGQGAMLGGLSGLGEDLIPYGMAYADIGRRAKLQGLNLVGLKRSNFDKKIILDAIHFYNDIFGNDNKLSIVESIKTVKKKYNNIIVNKIISFIEKDTKRQLCSSSKDLFINFIKQNNY